MPSKSGARCLWVIPSRRRGPHGSRSIGLAAWPLSCTLAARRSGWIRLHRSRCACFLFGPLDASSWRSRRRHLVTWKRSEGRSAARTYRGSPSCGISSSRRRSCPAQDSTLGLLHAVVRLRGARQEVSLSKEQLGRIRQPVLLIWGSRDAFGGPTEAQEAARLIPDSELCIVPGAGHVPWVGHPGEVTAAAVPFLRRHAA